MATTQAGSSPVSKRVRVGERTMLACTSCKHRKLKCDGQTPKCQNCIKSDRDCLVEDPATGLQRPRDYMQTLEARVAYLESLLQDARPDIALDHLTHRERQPEGNHVRHSPRSQIGDEVDRVSTDVALLCVSAAGREPHYFGPSSAISFSRIASQSMGLHPSLGASPLTVDDDDSEVRDNRKLIFPSRIAGAALSRAYFENVAPQYPFLHRPTFDSWEERCHEQWANADAPPTSHLPIFFVLMVYAIGSLALGPKHYDEAEAFYAAAMDRSQPVFDMDNLESLQAILACAVYSVRSPVGASLWKISGLAIRTCVELGYHRSTEKFHQSADSLTREISKRCFWTAYDIDRSISFILGRPTAIPDHAIDAELPLDIDDEHIT
ncbi:Positive regulator of purine utilization [Pseudocercospora fuligena]|uniref:Positive regulator of purine utilization n=1 Tax=Pseudocercospora fuligena TaxID=685502 RepID=A0A8H6RJT9_9PEZI|nr:Positive regulator of purine utilization [Pseudocercospora fuligena]